MQVTDAVPVPLFAGHESFHLRYSWLKKAYDAVKADPRAFAMDEAAADLGVGKNMAKSMRSWARAAKILGPDGTSRDRALGPTKTGREIFRDGGLDPDLEKKQTLWIVHWLLLSRPCRLPVWWMIMNDFPATSIEVARMAESIHNGIYNMEWNTPSQPTVRKDVDVFLHTYLARRGKMSVEDYLDCPLRHMGLVDRGRDPGWFRFVPGVKDGITPEVAAFACLDFASGPGTSAKEISVARCATESGGVGNAFRITERDLAGLLRKACRGAKSSRIEDVNGAPHLVFDGVEEARNEMLRRAYGGMA